MPKCDKFYVARLSAEKVITIIIEDTNDNSPEFVSVPTGLLSPATSPGAKITTVLATDRWEKTPASVCIWSLQEFLSPNKHTNVCVT
jgi:hypothetical protein